MNRIRQRLRWGAAACVLLSAPALGAPHVQVPLKDLYGTDVTTSNRPVSFDQSCSGCHDVDFITQGYHFQQGRTRRTATGQYVMQVSDTFNPEKSWLLSDGMYGKT